MDHENKIFNLTERGYVNFEKHLNVIKHLRLIEDSILGQLHSTE